MPLKDTSINYGQTTNPKRSATIGEVEALIAESQANVEADLSLAIANTNEVAGQVAGVSAQLVDIAYNPVLFGANKLGLGYSDDALTQIKSILKDGDRIKFPKGDYKFQNNVIFDKDIDIDFGGSTFTFDSQNGFIFNGTLKTTKTVTSDYTEVTSKNSLTLNDVSGIAVGDLINVISTELFKLTRIYYYKGGNAIVTKITGNVVYFNLVFPFDMKASSITVNIYKPIKANLKNINMLKNSNQQLVNTRAGMAVNYGANCKVENVKTDNFTYNLDFYRCVNVDLSMITTGHAKNSETDPFDGYGIAIESCTNITANFITTNSGQHGITTTGKEPVYNVTINKSTLKAETTNHGLGLHENIVNMVVNDSTVFGFWACGDVIFNNVKVLNSEISSADAQITVAQDPRYSNFTFNNCSFAQKVVARMQYQVYDPSTYKMGKVVFNNCKNIFFSTLLKFYEFPKGNSIVGEVDHVEFKNCEGYRMMAGDKIKKLVVVDSSPIDLVEPTIIQKTYNSTIEKVNEIYVSRSKFTNRFTDVSILLADKVVFDAVSYDNKTLGTGQGSWMFTNIGELVFTNSDMTLAERGIETFTGVSKLIVINSKMKFRLASTLTNVLLSVSSTSISGMTNLLSGVIENYDTATDGKKYKKEINASGVQTFTLVV